jgi:hypothetical protein
MSDFPSHEALKNIILKNDINIYLLLDYVHGAMERDVRYRHLSKQILTTGEKGKPAIDYVKSLQLLLSQILLHEV